MIFPRNKLLLWVAIVVLPFALLALVDPAAGMISLVAIGALLTLAIVDAISARTLLAGYSLRLPVVARMSKDRAARLEVSVRNEKQKAANVRLALALAPEIHSSREDMQVALPAGHEWSRFVWECLPRRRGNYRIEAARIEVSSPLGFWAARKTTPVQCEVRVYPNLAAERKSLSALFLQRGAFGAHAQRQVGKGREFEKLREYLPGDSFDEIHWKATARRGRPITKTFQIERTQDIYVIVDASRLSARPAAETRHLRSVTSRAIATEAVTGDPAFSPATTLERFLTAALVLGLAAESQGDRFGVLTFTNKVVDFVRAGNGKAHYGACRDALYALQPQVVTPDYDEICSFIRLRLRRRALLVILTALDDPVLAESFVHNMQLINRQHVVQVNMLQPPGVAPVFSNPDVISVDDLYEHLGGHLRWHNLRELGKVLQRHGVHFSLLHNERLSAELVTQYLNVKRRQLL